MSRILLAGFKGNANSAKVTLDKCTNSLEKLYLYNDFNLCATQIRTAVAMDYDVIVILGQKPTVKSIYIETVGQDPSSVYQTTFEYDSLIRKLQASGFKVRVSDNAGSYLCNHVYFNALSAVHDLLKQTQVIFLHIPSLKANPNVDFLASVLSDFLSNFS